MQNKNIFITGVSSGIGFATAKYFLERDWNAVLVTRKITSSLKKLESANCLLLEVDMKEKTSIKRARDRAIDRFGQIDVVVNNAGYGIVGPLETAAEEQISEELRVNLETHILVTRAFIPHFRKYKHGVFVNISSMMGKIPFPFLSLYNATKFAIEGFSESIAYELSPLNIHVKLIEPGVIHTNFFTSSLKKTLYMGTVYEMYAQKLLRSIVVRGSRGEEPLVVAGTIWRAVHDGKPFGRYIPDRTAKLLIFLRKITPVSLFRKILLQTI